MSSSDGVFVLACIRSFANDTHAVTPDFLGPLSGDRPKWVFGLLSLAVALSTPIMTYHKFDSNSGGFKHMYILGSERLAFVLIVITTLGPFANNEPPSALDSDASSDTLSSERRKAEVVTTTASTAV